MTRYIATDVTPRAIDLADIDPFAAQPDRRIIRVPPTLPGVVVRVCCSAVLRGYAGMCGHRLTSGPRYG